MICYNNRQWRVCNVMTVSSGLNLTCKMKNLIKMSFLCISDLPVACDIFDRSETISSSNVSTISSLSDEDYPVFHRAEKVTFLDMETVASSSARYDYRFE